MNVMNKRLSKQGLPGSLPRIPTDQTKEMCKALVLSEGHLKDVMKIFLQEIHRGLDKKQHAKASVKCTNTFIQDLPTGNEQGRFLVIDLGSSNFRSAMVSFKNGRASVESRVCAVPSTVMSSGNRGQLFGHISECVAEFCTEVGLHVETTPTAFTFNFPVERQAINAATLLRWEKGFKCGDAVGKDVTSMLREEYRRRYRVEPNVVAVVNNTVGTFMSCAWNNPTCRIGLVLGNEFEVCYVEKTGNVDTFPADPHNKKPHLVIDTQCGGFGDSGELGNYVTNYDRELEKHSAEQGRGRFAKMVCTAAMGELARIMIQACVEKGHVFHGRSSPALATPHSFLAAHLFEILEDEAGSYANCQKVLFQFDIPKIVEQDMIDVWYVCKVVATRSASLVAAVLATVVNKMSFETVTIGVESPLLRSFPYYRATLDDKLALLKVKKCAVQFEQADEGSIKGAAVTVAAYEEAAVMAEREAEAEDLAGAKAGLVAGSSTKTRSFFGRKF